MNAMRWKIAAGTILLGPILGLSLAASAQAPDTQPAQQGAPEAAPGGGPGMLPERPGGQWRGARGPERELAMLTHQLNLTPEQQTGVKAVLEQRRSQMQALRNKTESANADTPEARQARMTQMEQIRDESNTKISALLDENQKKTFADWVQKRKAAMARHQPEGGPPPPPNGEAPPPPPPGQD